VFVLEEGNPEYIEHQVNVFLRQADAGTRVHGKGLVPHAGEYTAPVMQQGLLAFLEAARPAGLDLPGVRAAAEPLARAVADTAAAALPARPPSFCIGCPERPVFSALKILQEEIGRVHIAADIGCHAFATYEPFSMGNSILGYGM
jgi:indolepyruvate ferredoxin oxidoreductase alpha subunit